VDILSEFTPNQPTESGRNRKIVFVIFGLLTLVAPASILYFLLRNPSLENEQQVGKNETSSPTASPELSLQVLADSSSFNAPPKTQPNGLAWDGKHLWLSSYMIAPALYKIDANNGTVMSKCEPLAAQYRGYGGLAYDGKYLWEADGYGGGVYKIDPVSCQVIQKFSSPDKSPRDLAWDGENLWMVGQTSRSIYKIRTSDGAVIDQFKVSLGSCFIQESGLEYADGFLWLAEKDALFKINPADGKVVSTLPLNISRPRGLAWDGKNLLVGSFDEGTITRVDISGPPENSPRADLQLTLSAPASARVGTFIEVPMTIKNAGIATAMGTQGRCLGGYMIDVVLSTDTNVPDRWAVSSSNYREDVLRDRRSNTSDIIAGGLRAYSSKNSLPADMPSGNYYVCARVDPGNNIAESNENNNVACSAIRVTSSNPVVSPLPLPKASPLSFAVTLKNVSMPLVAERGKKLSLEWSISGGDSNSYITFKIVENTNSLNYQGAYFKAAAGKGDITIQLKPGNYSLKLVTPNVSSQSFPLVITGSLPIFSQSNSTVSFSAQEYIIADGKCFTDVVVTVYDDLDVEMADKKVELRSNRESADVILPQALVTDDLGEIYFKIFSNTIGVATLTAYVDGQPINETQLLEVLNPSEESC